MKKLREFWLSRSLITKGKDVVDSYNVYLSEADASVDAYNHGDETIHVREVIEEENK